MGPLKKRRIDAILNSKSIERLGICRIFLIFSILFSPFLRRFLSRQYFVWKYFISSLSSPRNIFELLSVGDNQCILLAPDALYHYWDDESHSVELRCDQLRCQFMASLIFLPWLASLLAFSKFWKEYVDVLGVQFHDG